MDLRYHWAGLRQWVALVKQHGRPSDLFYFNGGIGDQLLCSALGRELRRRDRNKVWLMTRAPELFTANSDFSATPSFDYALIPWARISGTRVLQLYYQPLLANEGRDAPIDEPIIAALCRRAGVHGTVALRPYLPAVQAQQARRSGQRPRVAIQSSCLTARFPIPNKQWPIENFQAVAAALGDDVEFVQFGNTADPYIEGAVDRRGAAFLDVARELAGCDIFVGLVGFLMHLARAVECPSVIVYGGREPPEITGYACNVNLTNRPTCSPCWAYSKCDSDRQCLTRITPAAVVAAVRQVLDAPPPRPLPVASYTIEARADEVALTR